MNIIFFLLVVAPASLALQLSASEKQQMLDTHNLLRAQTARGEIGQQPEASNMMLMEWNDQLALSADTWVSKCEVGHDTKEERAMPGYSWVGQNWAGSYNTNHSTRVIAWFDEYKDYTYSTKGCTAVCGHYTQVVWAKSLMVGCAYAKCPKYPYHVVCNYATGGNWNGEFAYETGTPCSACMGEYTYCMGGVCASKSQCDRSGAKCSCTLTASSCQNGGTFDSANCACNCPTGFYGTRCESACKNADGWDYTCSNTVAKDLSKCTSGYGPYCTKTCGLCKTGTGVAQGKCLPRVLGAGSGSGAATTLPPATTTTAPPTAPPTTTVRTTLPQTTTLPPYDTTTSPPTVAPTTTTTTSTCTDLMGATRCAAYKDYCWAGTIKVVCGHTCGDCNANKECKDWTTTCAADQCWCYIRKALCKITCGVCKK